MRNTVLTTVVLTGIVGAAAASGATAAPRVHAPSGAHLTVAATSAGAWRAGTGLPVEVTVANTQQRMFCSGITVTLHWQDADGTSGRSSRTLAAPAGAASTRIDVPSTAVLRPTVRYWATAREACGLLRPQVLTGESSVGHTTVA